MKRLVCNLIAVLFIFSSAFTATHYAPTTGGDMIEDPGFENEPAGALTAGTRPWVGEEANQANIVNDSVKAHTGNQYFAFADGGGQLMQMVSVTPNTGYLLTAWTSGTPNLYLSPTTFVGSNMSSAGMFVAPNTGYP